MNIEFAPMLDAILFEERAEGSHLILRRDDAVHELDVEAVERVRMCRGCVSVCRSRVAVRAAPASGICGAPRSIVDGGRHGGCSS